MSEGTIKITPIGDVLGSGSMGLCCACAETEAKRNAVTLDFRAPVPGKGWGCFVCHLPRDGAVAVLCDDCFEQQADIRFVCVGYPADNDRMPIEEARAAGPFDHDLTRHPEAWPANNPQADMVWFDDSPDAGHGCTCSYCGQSIPYMPVRIFDEDNGRELRLHQMCLGRGSTLLARTLERLHDEREGG